MSSMPLTACVVLAIAIQPQVQAPLPTLPPPAIVTHRIIVLRDWVTAVHRHEPGESDAALLRAGTWSRDDVQALWIDVQILHALVKDAAAHVFHVKRPGERALSPVVLSRHDLDAMRTLAQNIPMQFASPDAFWKRTALFHTDVALQSEINKDVFPPAPLMSPGRIVLQTEDGQQVGLYSGVVHWEFARLFLDWVTDPPHDAFVRSWYRATLAHKLATEELDSLHFAHALELFPNDSVIRFQTGCLHDAFAHPAVQSVVDSAKLPARIRLDVRSESAELREAEAHFRRALDLDPSFGEARLRHGRVLARQGKHKDAASELRLAIEAAREPLLEYYARLFLGAEEEALVQLNAARTLYQQAAALYPRAQAPRLALSHLAHRMGDRAASREVLSDVLGSSAHKGTEDDPWWTYHMSAGRQAVEWMQATYRVLARGKS
jgi:tetratricopeptide (TPR) repeat protein